MEHLWLRGYVKGVRLFLENGAGGADINLAICTDPTNGTGCADALQAAAGVGNEILVCKLVELGAKTRIRLFWAMLLL